MRLSVLRAAALVLAAAVPTACGSSAVSSLPPGMTTTPMLQPDGATPATVKITLFNMPVKQTDPYDIALGASGYLYAAQPQGTPLTYLWQVSESGHIVKIKPGLGYLGPTGITGANGVVYFGREATGGGQLLAYSKGKFTVLADTVSYPYYLKTAKDGSVWFSDPGTYQVGHVVKGKTTLYMAPTKYCAPYGITIGVDQNAWVTELCATTTGRIGRITPNGSWKEYVLPTKNEEPPSGADSITAGPDGNLWYTIGASRVGRITTTGKIKEFPLPGSDGDGYGITVGNDKALWYTLQQLSKIGRMTTTGSASSYQVHGSVQLTGISPGAGNTIWFTSTISNQIGRLTY